MMRLLLDTNILLWFMGSGPELRGQARSMIAMRNRYLSRRSACGRLRLNGG